MKFQHGQRLDTFDALEELGPGDRVTIAGKPATVFDVVEGDEVYIVYVLDGRKTKKELSMFDAVLPSETSEEEEEEWDDAFGDPPDKFEEKPEVEVRYIAPGKDLFDEPGLRKSPGRRNRPMTSLVQPVAEGKTVRISKKQLRRIIRESLRENRASRLTLSIRLSPDEEDIELQIGESGATYNLGNYVNGSGLGGLMNDIADDHGGMMIPPGTMVDDTDGIVVASAYGRDPIEEMFQYVADMYAGL